MTFGDAAVDMVISCQRKIEMSPGAQSRDDTPVGGGRDEGDLNCILQ